jgi:hypothetical protein
MKKFSTGEGCKLNSRESSDVSSNHTFCEIESLLPLFSGEDTVGLVGIRRATSTVLTEHEIQSTRGIFYSVIARFPVSFAKNGRQR